MKTQLTESPLLKSSFSIASLAPSAPVVKLNFVHFLNAVTTVLLIFGHFSNKELQERSLQTVSLRLSYKDDLIPMLLAVTQFFFKSSQIFKFFQVAAQRFAVPEFRTELAFSKFARFQLVIMNIALLLLVPLFSWTSVSYLDFGSYLISNYTFMFLLSFVFLALEIAVCYTLFVILLAKEKRKDLFSTLKTSYLKKKSYLLICALSTVVTFAAFASLPLDMFNDIFALFIIEISLVLSFVCYNLQTDATDIEDYMREALMEIVIEEI